MPPLLAALLMIELGCDWRIVEAIDLGQEWRRWQPAPTDCANRAWYIRYPTSWYAGWLGYPPDSRALDPRALQVGTFLWPAPEYGQRY